MIVNKINGKTYVGKRCLYKRAWNNDDYMGSGKYLECAKNKYGIDNFEKFLICYTSSRDDANEKEKFWIAEYRSRGKAEYNISNGGDGGNPSGKNNSFYGKHHSEETKRKIRLAKKGLPSNRKGATHTEASKQKMSIAFKGKHWKVIDGKRIWY